MRVKKGTGAHDARVECECRRIRANEKVQRRNRVKARGAGRTYDMEAGAGMVIAHAERGRLGAHGIRMDLLPCVTLQVAVSWQQICRV